MQIRQYHPDELAGFIHRALATAWEQLAERERPSASDAGIVGQMAQMYRTALCRPGGTVLVLEGAGGAPAAHTLVVPQANPFTGEGELVILDIFVEPALRGYRVGQRLLAEADRYARSLGCAGLVAQVALQNEASLRLFQGVGFQPERLVLGRRCRGDSNETETQGFARRPPGGGW